MEQGSQNNIVGASIVVLRVNPGSIDHGNGDDDFDSLACFRVVVALVYCHSMCRSFVWCLVSVLLVWVGVPPVPPPPPSPLMLLLLLVIRKREDLLRVPILTTGSVVADNDKF